MKFFKLELNCRDIAVMGLSVALMVVFGKVLFAMSKVLPIPSSRVLVSAPVFTFILTLMVIATRKIGTVSIVSGLYAILMLRFSIFSFAAIFLSGILCDIMTLVIFKSYKRDRNIFLSVPLKSFFSVWTSYFFIKLFVKHSPFVQSTPIATLIVSILIYFIALLSSIYAIKLFERRMGIAKTTLSH